MHGLRGAFNHPSLSYQWRIIIATRVILTMAPACGSLGMPPFLLVVSPDRALSSATTSTPVPYEFHHSTYIWVLSELDFPDKITDYLFCIYR